MNPQNDNRPHRIFLSPPGLSGYELSYIQEAIDSNYIAPLGPQVDAFEDALAAYTGKRFALAVSSGTAAMHLALHAVGVRPGNVVLASTLTFIGSVAPILFLGAIPVFVDSDPETWNLDPFLLSSAIEDLEDVGRLPAAVIPTDIYGQCADYDAIETVCEKHGIPLIIDAAESFGATYKGRPAGCVGKAAILSFNGNKIITTSGGGALLTDDEELATYARKLSQQAREPFPHYEHSEIGYNYRMSNILAAIGRGQLHVLDERVATRRKIFQYYRERLSDIPGIEFMPEALYGRCNRWLTVILINAKKFGADREDVRIALEKENIESRPVWKPMHLQPVFNTLDRNNVKRKVNTYVIGGRVAEDLFKKGLCLPSGTALSHDDLDRIIGIIVACHRPNKWTKSNMRCGTETIKS